jgi:hypothetical protein
MRHQVISTDTPCPVIIWPDRMELAARKSKLHSLLSRSKKGEKGKDGGKKENGQKKKNKKKGKGENK